MIDLEKGKVEKDYFRSLLDEFSKDLLPKDIVWRKKCMFGDGADTKDTVRKAFFKYYIFVVNLSSRGFRRA